MAQDLLEDAWEPLNRAARYEIKTMRRARPAKAKELIVKQRKFDNIRLQGEDVTEMPYRPKACKKAYRLSVVRKNLTYSMGQKRLFDECLYFFYLTNEKYRSAQEIIFEANQRCNQEYLHAQLKQGVCALTAPVDTMEANWAYLVMSSLAWNLKAWWALWPETEKGSDHEKRQIEKETIL